MLDPAFELLRTQWDNPSAHERFANLAQRSGLLDAAAARYRKVLRDRSDDETARAALDRIALIATHQQQVVVRFSDGTLMTLRVLSVIVASTVALLVGYILFSMLRR